MGSVEENGKIHMEEKNITEFSKNITFQSFTKGMFSAL